LLSVSVQAFSDAQNSCPLTEHLQLEPEQISVGSQAMPHAPQ
jgi:hypothetical protein